MSLAERATWGADHVTMTFDVPWRPGFAVFAILAVVTVLCLGEGALFAVPAVGLGLWALRRAPLVVAREQVLFRTDARSAWLDGAHGQLSFWELRTIRAIEDQGGRLRIESDGGQVDVLDLRCLDPEDRAWLAELFRTAVRRARDRVALPDDPEALAALKRVVRRA